MSMPSRVALTPNCAGLTRAVGDLGGVQQRLGGDAADVQAGAAELALLDQSHPQPELRGAQGAGVAAGPGPEDEYVEVGHSAHPCTLRARVSTGLLPTLVRRATGTLGAMSWMDRFRRGPGPKMSRPTGDAARTGSTRVRASDRVDQDHLHDFVAAARKGVEGFVEPRTAVSDVTLLLVAHDGEWTRRRVPSVEWAHKFCNKHQVPSYDAAVVGIPQRMRDFNRRKKQQGL